MSLQLKHSYVSAQGTMKAGGRMFASDTNASLPVLLFLASYPPRECGIATYTKDLLSALSKQFHHSFELNVCAIESNSEQWEYMDEVKYILNTDYSEAFITLASLINNDPAISIVVIQHEFGLFRNSEHDFHYFIKQLVKPVVIVFHTVLPGPDELLKAAVKQFELLSQSIVVMTNHSAQILREDYEIKADKITVIPHGTHLVAHPDKNELKKKYHLSGKKILSTFGLLSSGKGIETTLEALPSIIEKYPDVQFLIIGKTHPSVLKLHGEQYRLKLEEKVRELHLQNNVTFIPYFLALPALLDYLQLTDIYLFTSKDPKQAVSGTFSYAISSGCPVISTPIPHAAEVLGNDAGIIIDFEHPQQLSEAVLRLLDDEVLQKQISSNGLHRMASTAWENAAIAHAKLFQQISKEPIVLDYKLQPINLNHLKKLTTDFGMIQFSVLNQPDIVSGYTLDDNARALIAVCSYYKLTKDESVLQYIHIYLNFIQHCLQTRGYFLNYVNKEYEFTDQNQITNLADSNGRAIWALGYVISLNHILPSKIINTAEAMVQSVLPSIKEVYSTRAMAFIIKGLYYRNLGNESEDNKWLITHLSNRLVQMYRHESDTEWKWFESYLTYANSIVPEALLCAWQVTGEVVYRDIAVASFDFLLSKIFTAGKIRVVSNKHWLHRDHEAAVVPYGGEQPIDVAYTIIALSRFYEVFDEESYRQKMKTAFSWFMGNNHLHRIIYNPCTGGCYDGLEESDVNLNQGAESTVSCLMARLTMEVLPSSTIENHLNGISNIRENKVERVM